MLQHMPCWQDIRLADPHRQFVEMGKAVGDTSAVTLFIADAVLDPMGITNTTLRVLEALKETLLAAEDVVVAKEDTT